jgi:gluconolactonase
MSDPSLAQPDVQVIADGVGFTEGPVVVPGGIAFVSDSLGCVYILGDSPRMRRVDTGGGPNGLACDVNGTIFVTQNGGAWFGSEAEPGIQRIDPEGAIDYIATGFEAPNDLCFGPDGRLYFTDPRRTTAPYDPEITKPGRLFSCERDGSGMQLVHEGILFINGLAFDTEGTTLYLAEMTHRRILAAEFHDGSIGELREIITLEQGAPDGFALDVDGNIWLPSQRDDAVFVVDPAGKITDMLRLPEGSWPTNCCFAGDDMRTLVVTASRLGRVVQVQVPAEGLPLYPHR